MDKPNLNFRPSKARDTRMVAKFNGVESLCGDPVLNTKATRVPASAGMTFKSGDEGDPDQKPAPL